MKLSLDRCPPQEIDSERATLGTLLLNPDAVPRVTNVLHDSVDVFYVEAHQHIYAACLDLMKVRTPIDEITLTAQLRKNEKLEKVGGAAYIAELTTVVPTSVNAEYYAKIVLNAARRRKFIEKSNLLAVASWQMGPEEYRRFLADLDLDEDFDAPDDAAASDILHAGELPDPIWIRGPGPAKFALLAGEGGSSKSYLMLSIAVMMATGRVTLPAFTPNVTGPVVFLAYEDGPAIMLFRLKAIAAAANISFDVIEEALIMQRLRFVCNPPGPLFQHEKSGSNTTGFFHAFENVVRDTKPVLTIIDPLSGAARLVSENANTEMGEIAQYLINFAQRNTTTVVLLHHANKSGMADGKRMTIYNIRGATSLVTKSRWTALMYHGNIDGCIVLDVQKNNDYGEEPKIPLARGVDGALIASNASVESSDSKRATSKLILRGAEMVAEAEKCYKLKVRVCFPGNDKDEIERVAWFPKSQTDRDGDLWLARPWIIAKKEEEIAIELGAAACKILTGAGEVAKKPESKPEAGDNEECLF